MNPPGAEHAVVARTSRCAAFGIALAVALSALFAASPSGQAQTPFYAGKTVELLVTFAPGGGTDLDARFFATFFEKHTSGNPRVIVRNMPGGGGITGANWYWNNVKTDGMMVIAASGSNKIPFILGVPQVQYDFRKWKLIKVNGVGGAVYVSPRTGIRKVEDLLRPQERLVYGSISPTSVDLTTLLAFEVLGMDVKAVFGFEGRGPARLAFERGEISIDHQTTPAFSSQVGPLVKEGKAIPIFSLGQLNERGQIVRDPGFAELPTVYEAFQTLYKNKPDGYIRYKAYRAILSAGFSFQKTFWLPEGTPVEAIRALHEAVDRMQRDPVFQQQAKVVLEGYPVTRGDLAETTVLRSLNITLDVRQYILNLLRTKFNVAI